ncbi:MAG: DUF4175 family protein [Candidatus Neomarinimicrobiota bacterium]
MKIFLWTIIIFSTFLFLLIQLESIFYFYPTKKIFFLLSSSIIFGLVIVYWLIYFFQAQRDRIKKYKFDHIAKILGNKVFPKKNDHILNAFQLESGAEQNESEALAKSYIKDILNQLKVINLNNYFNNKRIHQLKSILLILWTCIIVIFFINYNSTADAFYRLTNPKKEFLAPKPFTLSSLSGNLHIIGGEKAEIFIKANPPISDTLFLNLIPSQASTQKRDSIILNFSVSPIEDGIYNFKLPELFQDYSYQAIIKAKYFWEAWENVTTEKNMIFVTDRPTFEDFSLTTIPPKYSKLEKQIQKGNVAMVEGLKGSIIQIDLRANRMLKNSYISINEEQLEMSSSYNLASGYFKLNEEGHFTVNIVDKRGITNKDPIPYKMNIIPDYEPSIYVIKPNHITELENDQTIPIKLKIEDDYGFSDLQLAYEIQRPTYLQADPYVAMIKMNQLHSDSISQRISMFWDLTDMMLMPDDEVHFHFELTDNDEISGPKKIVSRTFIAKVPSLADLYENIEYAEKNVIDDIVSGLDDIEEIKNQLEKTELKMLKSEELDWNEQQSIKKSLENSKEKINKLEKIADTIASITDQAEKHKLLSPNLLEKFQELSELISQIIPEEMMTNIEELEMALENMDMDTLEEALNELSENMTQIEEDLDRYLELFKKFQAEQKLDEIQNRMEKLYEQQVALNNEMTNNKNDISNNERLAQEQKRNLDEFENILSLTEEASKLIEPLNENSSQQLNELSESPLSDNIESNFDKTIENLKKQNNQEAINQSEAAMMNLEKMMQQMTNIQQGFNEQEITEIMKKFQDLLQNILYLSSQQEQLKNNVKQTSRNSPRLRELARKQQLLQDQLQSMTQKMYDLSNETFAITPDISRGIGKSNAGMEDSKSKLTDRNISQAEKSQSSAMEGLNEAALGLFNSMQNMQESGSASGFEQFMQMMQEMTGKQQALNNKGMQLSLGQMAAAAQQQMMQKLLDGQKSIRKSLEQLMKEMRHSGNNSLGDLSGMTKDMDEIIKDLQKNRFNRKTQDRQQRILSRMLDSQASMTQRGEKDERKSSSVKNNLVFKGPGGMPSDLGQRENLALQALNKALNAGYSKEHQSMIKKYFNFLSQTPQNISNENNEDN